MTFTKDQISSVNLRWGRFDMTRIPRLRNASILGACRYCQSFNRPFCNLNKTILASPGVRPGSFKIP